MSDESPFVETEEVAGKTLVKGAKLRPVDGLWIARKQDPQILARLSEIKAASNPFPTVAGTAFMFFAGAAYTASATAGAARRALEAGQIPSAEALAQLTLYNQSLTAALVCFVGWVLTFPAKWAATQDLRDGKRCRLTEDRRLVDWPDKQESEVGLKGWRAWILRQLRRVLTPSRWTP